MPQDRVRVERLGGLAGFGLPRGRLKSRGELSLAALDAADRAAIEALFVTHRPRAAGASVPDGFSYRLTGEGANGPLIVEVPEHCVPAVVRDCVRDVLE